MRISHNELLTGVRKAFEGLGFEAGDAEDAADMVAWLEIHGLGGIAELGKALRFLEAEGSRAPETAQRLPALRVFDSRGASVLSAGGLAVDAGVAMARTEGLANVHLLDCHNRLLITGYLARSARRGVSVLAFWHNGADPGASTVVSLRAGDELPTLRRYTPRHAPDDAAGRHLALVFSDEFDLWPQLHEDMARGRTLLSVTPETLAHQEAVARQSGVTVDTGTWQALKNLAARILV